MQETLKSPVSKLAETGAVNASKLQPFDYGHGFPACHLRSELELAHRQLGKGAPRDCSMPGSRGWKGEEKAVCSVVSRNRNNGCRGRSVEVHRLNRRCS